MKNCKDCRIQKNISEFYRHPKMKDGHLNKCIECVKKRIHKYWQDGRGKIVDKKRQQKPARKEWQRQQSARMRIKHAAKYKVRGIWWNWFKNHKDVKTDCQKCGSAEKIEAHHCDYNKPLEIMWLCCKHHKEWHRQNIAIYPYKP